MEETGKKDRNGIEVMKPAMIRSYNMFMGGVDRVDQQLHGLRTIRKTYKWYKKLTMRIISQAALNAHKVFQHRTGNNQVDFLHFLHDLIAMLVTLNPVIENDVPLDPTIQRLTGRHFPHQKQPTGGNTSKRPAKPCHVCYARNIRTAKGGKVNTVYVCPSCHSEPGLHPDVCFEAYHTKLDYSK